MSNKANNNNNEKQVENFTTVWDSVRRAKTVNGFQFKAIDKLLYSYLLGWQVSKDDPNNKKVTKVNSSVRELQQELGVSKGTIETSLKTLEKMGLIVIKSGGVGFSNEYDVSKFSDVESTNVEIKVDQFMENRKEYRAEKQNNKGWVYESGNKAEVENNANAQGCRDEQTKIVGVRQEIKQDDLPDSFLGDCGVSHDSAFEDYNSTRGAEPYGSINTQPKPIKSVKHSHYDEDGRLCAKCYQKRVGGAWYCTDSDCFNNVPF
ncbi:HTH domain-containing protein [Aeromonas sp. 1HA1]|uniref:HTH domain-containing protein n=1 Tax=Aeromonas sp. 1HA1 TaxID=2699193 RepID=UPI0023DDFB61|nr:HTH domain-containing protein [Aeromonas sp. 1HA1]MDF2413905.1 HTH domain-containing protein [Aeromonas sp. 1HA1]